VVVVRERKRIKATTFAQRCMMWRQAGCRGRMMRRQVEKQRIDFGEARAARRTGAR